jgi:hypothetical protein
MAGTIPHGGNHDPYSMFKLRLDLDISTKSTIHANSLLLTLPCPKSKYGIFVHSSIRLHYTIDYNPSTGIPGKVDHFRHPLPERNGWPRPAMIPVPIGQFDGIYSRQYRLHGRVT